MTGRLKCSWCKNLVEKNEYPTPWKCRAFPDGMPEEKLMYITRDPCINCNNGIGFEPKEEKNETAQ